MSHGAFSATRGLLSGLTISMLRLSFLVTVISEP